MKIDLGTLGGASSSANAINDTGQIVGWSYTSNGVDHAFLWSSGNMVDLNSLIDPASGWTLEGAGAITNLGWIVGTGRNAFGETHAYLLTPAPEPIGLSLFATVGLLVLRRRW